MYSVPHTIRMVISRRIRLAENLARMEDRRGAYMVLVCRPKRWRPLGRSKRRWEDNIKLDSKEVDCKSWPGLIWLRIGTGYRKL